MNSRIERFRRKNQNATNEEVYPSVVSCLEVPEMMSQISPRIFEAIALCTVLVLFEGRYSNVERPSSHFLPLKKQGSNLDEVFSLLAAGEYFDNIAECAYQDITSGKYSCQSFVSFVDKELEYGKKSLWRINFIMSKK